MTSSDLSRSVLKPLDPRLLRYAGATRGILLQGVILGFFRTVAIIVWSWCVAMLLAQAVAPVLGGPRFGLVLDALPPASQTPLFVVCALAAVIVRACTTWAMETVSARGAVRVKNELRRSALNTLEKQSPLRFSAAEEGSAHLPTTLGRGLDALDNYFSNYIPQLLLTAVATPILIAVLLWADWLSATIVIVVFPVIPLFMVLIGIATRFVQNKQWEELNRLSNSFLDTISGLGTLKIFGREGKQRQNIEDATEGYRKRTMQVLRVTFLSGFVLDLAGTFSVALVAVTVGTRLVDGLFPLGIGLFVLLLLPEVFIPIRQVGVAYHASAEGLAAANNVFALIDNDAVYESALHPATEAEHLELNGVSVDYGHGAGPLLNLSVAPGEYVALTGPSGSGKTSALNVLMGFVPAVNGKVQRTAQLAWVGQKPGLLQGSVFENLSLGGAVLESDARAVLEELGLATLPLEKQLGALGHGVSGGQAQRIAIARALLFAKRFPGCGIVMDEPSSALDAASEKLVALALRRRAAVGHPVLIVSHREALIESADRAVRIAEVAHG
ncbi:thiol reductant ABC exporter subunit CydD [Canibacter zhoujuaniae]|uniref:thiol reductant ABC exporter subunit CydD n=1 Tax=Canibacter zhoujuaniae TaxID=2708343 RepID=UPI001FB8DA4D|nr:thiol reductant ABC exporter subunit CydD [Canibacter zhoujuaniae]